MSKQVAHFKVAFVSAVPPSYLCSLCGELFKFPCHVNCCQTYYCQGCIGRFKQMDRPCPNCAEKDFMVISDDSDSTLKANVDGLKVYCPMRKNGCKWTGRLEVLDDHLMWGEGECTDDTCRVVPVQCVSGCGTTMPRGSMKSHLRNSCKRRETSCKYCGVTESYDQLTKVHYSVCHKYHVSCPNGCKVPGIERSQLKAHLETGCPLRIVNCEFHFAGCGEELRLSDQSRHMTNAVTTHLGLLSTFTRSIQVENKELRSYCTRLENVCVSLQRDCARLAADLADLQQAMRPAVPNHRKQIYENDQGKSSRSQKPLPPLPVESGPFKTQVNHSYSVSSEPGPDVPPSPGVVPRPRLEGVESNGNFSHFESSPPPPLPPRSLSMKRSSELSVFSAEWPPNDSTDTSDQLSPNSSEGFD